VPTNLPPEYYEADKRYRAAQSPAEKIASLEALISTIPKHKGTDHLRAGLRQRLSKLKSTAETKKSLGRYDSAYNITNASPEVADFPHTTWSPTPGMMPVENIQIQLIDTPPLSRDYVAPDFLDLMRRVDLMLIVVDVQNDPLQQLEDTVAILSEHGLAPRHLQAKYPDQLRLTFIPCLVVANKNDDEQSDENVEIFCELLEETWPLLPVSTMTGRQLERLKACVFEALEIIRVFTKAPGQEPDFTAPFVLEKGGTVLDLAEKIHHDFVDKLKIARVWGKVDFDGQMVKRDHVLHDGDVVELHI
jgi:ribosome-interacting GTPase 1